MPLFIIFAALFVCVIVYWIWWGYWYVKCRFGSIGFIPFYYWFKTPPPVSEEDTNEKK